MAIKKRSINEQGNQTDYKHLISKYNDSNINNFSHLSNQPSNFNLKTITLEDIDMSVYQEFNNRFIVKGKQMPLILLDAEVTSLKEQNFIQYDEKKGFLNLPFFTIYRKSEKMLHKTNPTYKTVIYSTPKQKANGLVIEDYISEGPIERILNYELSFISNYRDTTNEMEQQMSHYFRNKRNIIICNNERFSIGPENQDVLSEVELVNREDVEQRTLYLSTFNLKLWCYTRNLDNMQKRERPNTFLLDISVNDNGNVSNDKNIIKIDQFETNNKDFPKHPIS